VVWTVSQLTAEIKWLVEAEFAKVWVVGEISKLTRHDSGHIYLTLKDDRSVVSAKIWKSVAARLPFEIKVGLEVVVQGRISVWEPRGEYSLIIEHLQPQGMGALELAFRQLFEKLQREGLFAPERKQRLPEFPRRIVLVTSPTGAAVRDMIQVIGRRWRNVEILVRPVRVQGEGAAAEIAQAIAEVDRLKDVDVMIVGRGGGSLEDLWAFNEELVARAIFACRTPVISAVGHEVDWTISDHVADVRAPTPSAAAELVVPSEVEVREHLLKDARRMVSALRNRLQSANQRIAQLAERRPFRFPFDAIFQRHQRCDEWGNRMERAIAQRLRDGQHRMGRLADLLDGLSPLKVLARGYSLTTRDDGKTVVRRDSDVNAGELIITRLASGKILSRVEKPKPIDQRSGPSV
jgi:exodeoxyribonuclease VII large subunit